MADLQGGLLDDLQGDPQDDLQGDLQDDLLGDLLDDLHQAGAVPAAPKGSLQNIYVLEVEYMM